MLLKANSALFFPKPGSAAGAAKEGKEKGLQGDAEQGSQAGKGALLSPTPAQHMGSRCGAWTDIDASPAIDHNRGEASGGGSCPTPPPELEPPGICDSSPPCLQVSRLMPGDPCASTSRMGGEGAPEGTQEGAAQGIQAPHNPRLACRAHSGWQVGVGWSWTEQRGLSREVRGVKEAERRAELGATEALHEVPPHPRGGIPGSTPAPSFQE